MSPQTVQLITTVVAALIIAAIIAIARWVGGKADKTEVSKVEAGHVKLESKVSGSAEKVDLNRVESEYKTALAKMEIKLDAALLIVATSITRPELAEKVLAMTGRSDDRMARVVADIVQLGTDVKANAKATTETEKRLDDLPGRVRTLEENQKRS